MMRYLYFQNLLYYLSFVIFLFRFLEIFLEEEYLVIDGIIPVIAVMCAWPEQEIMINALLQ